MKFSETLLQPKIYLQIKIYALMPLEQSNAFYEEINISKNSTEVDQIYYCKGITQI